MNLAAVTRRLAVAACSFAALGSSGQLVYAGPPDFNGTIGMGLFQSVGGASGG